MMSMEFLPPASLETTAASRQQAGMEEPEENALQEKPEDLAETAEIASQQPMDAAYRREIDHLLTQMQANSVLERRAIKRMGIFTILLGYGLGLGVVFLLAGQITLVAYSMVMLALGALLAVNLRAIRRYHKESQQVMTQISSDVRAVGALLSFLEGQNQYRATITIYSILKQLLPHLRTDHARLLSDEQMRILLKLLRYTVKRDDDLTLSILKALEQIGDQRAVGPVQSLTSSRRSAIRNAAQECMPFLTLRAQQQDKARTLLRPSQAEAIPSATLLRPASTTGEADGTQLLRPTEEII